MIKKILTIAGSDSGGGAGIQADLKTFQEYGTFGISSITSLLSVDPQTRIPNIFPIPYDVMANQLRTAFSGGSLDAVKLGLLGSTETVNLIESYLLKNRQRQIVLDPVMAVKVGNEVLQPELLNEMINRLIPLADVITPNLVEARILADMTSLTTKEDMEVAAKKIYQLGAKNVVVKGGNRLPGDKAIDLLYNGSDFLWFESQKQLTPTNHGAGCSFAAAITAGIGKGLSVEDAVRLAKKYVLSAIKNGIYLNDFTGYVWHGAYQEGEKRMTHGN
ncbi:bifunctional hydroxymethylpyrimidine kinase/phosphomethylpyrimidine kinase [Vagococcus fluvialis]|uniref:bifunctional hydroxymethylpyrimidine kinase/phosphomethylpyrimidine kinase n=1 Tax=Vagococcus fluvialis TaxID=2738 RepID=UPI003B5C2B39